MDDPRGDGRGAALKRLRRSHQDTVLAALARPGGLSRAELAEHTGLSRSTLYTIVGDLLADGAVLEVPGSAVPGSRGRRATRITANPRGAVRIGLDIGRSRVHVAFVDTAGRRLATGTRQLPPLPHWNRRTDAAIGLIRKVAADHDLSAAAPRGIGIGLPGPVHLDERGRILGEDTRIRQLRRVQDRIGEAFGAPTAVGNNTRYAALGEALWGGARGAENVLYIRVSDAVGGGIVCQGRLLTGRRGAAGELGHLVADPAGPPCYCGGSGCLETYTAIPALLEQCRENGLTVADAADLVRAVRAEDPAACRAVTGAADLLGAHLARLAAVFDPDQVIVGGPLAGLDRDFLARIRSLVRVHCLASVGEPPEVRAAELDDDAGALGAVAALERGSEPLSVANLQAR
ncbi:hypothetical protein BIV57_01285 [Mangrovactinospora gilvigrisea]|uniref:Uncharacterized protein n=2 Tax=Mangrovactinospora gilvigrisea TaxID=1428644 RepID=A0A1J7CIR8_9ACTN|nr:hypothetical protein BIV57_01285 [Mangrovactinospora gilvigrisea]